METLKYWFIFVNNIPTSTRKLVLLIFGCKWLGWKWIATWKTRPLFFKFLLYILSFLREEEREDPGGLVVVTLHVTTGDDDMFMVL